MNHIGIDIGGRESQICITQADGKIVGEHRWATAAIGEYLTGLERCRVVVETCAESFRIADTVMDLGHEIRVVPGTLVRTLGVGARGLKTDRRDAQALAKASTYVDLPSVHIPSANARQWRSLLTARQSLVTARTQLVNSTRGIMRTFVSREPSGAPEQFPDRVRKHLIKHLGHVPLYVDSQLAAIATLTTSITTLTQQIAEVASHEPVCRLLQTAPGVGPITSLAFVSAIDCHKRFANAESVQSYLGLTAGERSSSEKQRRLGITKAGPAIVRQMLAQVCWSVWRLQPHSALSRWGQEVALRRGKRIAIVAMARKLSGILYAMWRDNRPYQSAADVLPEAATMTV